MNLHRNYWPDLARPSGEAAIDNYGLAGDIGRGIAAEPESSLCCFIGSPDPSCGNACGHAIHGFLCFHFIPARGFFHYTAQHICIEAASDQSIDPDAIRRILLSSGLGKRQYASFRHRVESGQSCSTQPIHRGSVDDCPAAGLLFLHLFQFIFHAKPNALEIQADFGVEILFSKICGTGQLAECGSIIEGTVEPSESPDRLCDQCLHLSAFRNIGLDEESRTACSSDFLFYLLSTFASARCYHDGSTSLGEQSRRSSADTSTSARNYNNFSLHHINLSRLRCVSLGKSAGGGRVKTAVRTLLSRSNFQHNYSRCGGFDSIILHLHPCQYQNGAAHRVYIDTPPLVGSCLAPCGS